MNYIGSKLTLLPEIAKYIPEPDERPALDMFMGSSVVSQMFKQMGYAVCSNDIQAYSAVYGHAFISTNGYPQFEKLMDCFPSFGYTRPRSSMQRFGVYADVPDADPDSSYTLRLILTYLERIPLPLKRSQFFDEYCAGGAEGRCYFSSVNGQRIAAIRNLIETWLAHDLLEGDEYALLVCALLESLDRVANTASVYAAHLKHIKASARRPLELRIPALPTNQTRAGEHQVFMMSADELAARLGKHGRRFGVVYLDPPYNGRQYSSNYHILETVARWDLDQTAAFKPYGRTGQRPIKHASPFCSKRQVAQALGAIVQNVHAQRLLMSYSTDGLMTEAEIITLLRTQYAQVEVVRFPYKRFQADADKTRRTYSSSELHELLFVADRGC